MYAGIINPNMAAPVEKMMILNVDTQAVAYVLYNPQSYQLAKSVNYSKSNHLNSDSPMIQFMHGGEETLTMELFFDSVSAGGEVGGGMLDKGLFTANSLLPSAGGLIDVRKYTKQVYDLMHICPQVHRPPILVIKWASLQFVGFLERCTERCTKFNERGVPVRAVLNCTFLRYIEADKLNTANPLESPDTTKFRTIREGDSLWSLAQKEYGDPAQWRVIARANGISNPRMLKSGDTLVIPALD